MDPRRLRTQDWLIALFAGALLGSLWLDWYEAAGADHGVALSGWRAFSVTDVVVAAAAGMALVLVLLTAGMRSNGIPVAFSALTAPVVSVAAIWLSIRSLSLPEVAASRSVGAVVAPAFVWLLFVSLWSTIRSEHPGFAPPPAPAIDELDAPAGNGG